MWGGSRSPPAGAIRPPGLSWPILQGGGAGRRATLSLLITEHTLVPSPVLASAARSRREEMPELVALGVEIALSLRDGRGDDRDLVDDAEVVAVIDEGVGLLGVVREQSDLRQAQVLEDLQADPVVAGVRPVAEGEVGLDGVEALVLEVVRADLLDQADPAPFLGQVDEGPRPLVPDHGQRHVELVPAIAPQRVEQVAREA